MVVVPFPFSDLTDYEKRPALVVAELDGNDRILCQITSQFKDDHAIQITQDDFEKGTLRKICNVRPSKIFTADRNIILYRAGHLKTEKIDAVINKLVEVFSK